MTVVTTQTVVANNAWTALGAGPMALQAIGDEVFVAVAASTPGATLGASFVLRPRDGRQDFNTTSNIFVMSAAPLGSAIVESAPMTA